MTTTEEKPKKPPTRRQIEGRERAAAKTKERTAARKELLARLLEVVKKPDPFADLAEIVMLHRQRVLPPPPAPSRNKRWEDAAATAEASIQDLVDIQQEFSDWKDNLGDGLSQTPVGQKLEEVCNIDLDSAMSAVQEATGADLPLGWGKD